jgi:hypothetical protein
MPVSIEDVLVLLPELFPAEQPIPLNNIKPNPFNPGPTFTQEKIDKMADDLNQNGLWNAITVRPHPTKPLVDGVQLHPDNPRLRGDGQPWKLEDFNFEILGGHLRTLGAEKLKWPTIKGVIKNWNNEDAAVFNHKVHIPTKAPSESNPKRPPNPIESARLEGVRRGANVV